MIAWISDNRWNLLAALLIAPVIIGPAMAMITNNPYWWLGAAFIILFPF